MQTNAKTSVKTNVRSTAKQGRKTEAKKAPLSPEEAQLQAQIADIQSVTDVKAAFKSWTDLLNQVNDKKSHKEKLTAEARGEDKLRAKAAQDQDYQAAQKHKEAHATLMAEADAIGAQLMPLIERRDAAQVHHTELFLADEGAPYNREESVTLYRIQVINPVTKNFESVHYLDSSDTVDLQLDGESFSSEAYNLFSWAVAQGYVVRRDERPISF